MSVPDTASYIRGWIQMVLAPNDLFSWNNKYNKYNEYNVTCFSLAMHTNLLCACWHLEAMKGSSSLTSCRLLILSRLLSFSIWAQLTLLVPALGIRSPLPQNGAPIHRVRAHSLTGIRNNEYRHRHRNNWCWREQQGSPLVRSSQEPVMLLIFNEDGYLPSSQNLLKYCAKKTMK
jgi:hypothetical protein